MNPAMSKAIGVLLIIAGVVLAIWLGLVVMLYGGIMQAVTQWGTNDSAVVWGILRALFCEIGIIPGLALVFIGLACIVRTNF